MPTFLVPDLRNRSLCLLTAADQATAQSWSARYLPTSDPLSIGTALSAPAALIAGQVCRLTPMVVS